MLYSFLDNQYNAKFVADSGTEVKFSSIFQNVNFFRSSYKSLFYGICVKTVSKHSMREGDNDAWEETPHEIGDEKVVYKSVLKVTEFILKQSAWWSIP